MSKIENCEKNVCLTYLTKNLSEFQNDELQELLQELYSSKDKNKRFLATIINSIFTGKRAYFGLSRQLFTQLLSNDPNIKANTISGSDFKQLLNLELKKYCSMIIGFSTAHKTPAIWELDGGLFGEIFRKVNPTISKEMQLSECKKFIDPNSTTYLTVEETSTEREKEREVEPVPTTLNKYQEGKPGSETALKEAKHDDWYKGFLNDNLFPAEGIYDSSPPDPNLYFGYRDYSFRKGYELDYDEFLNFGHHMQTFLLLEAGFKNHPNDWKSVLIYVIDYIHINWWELWELNSVLDIIYKEIIPVMYQSSSSEITEEEFTFGKLKINKIINIMARDKVYDAHLGHNFKYSSAEQYFWIGLDE